MKSQESLLRAIRAAEPLVHGRLYVMKRPNSRAYYNLQSQVGGKKKTRYVPEAEVSRVRRAIENYRAFMEKVGKYVEEQTEKTLRGDRK